MRIVLNLRDDVVRNPRIRPVHEAAMRSLGRPQNARFAESILRTLEPSEMLTLDGTPIQTFAVDAERLGLEVARITAGLFFFVKGRRVPTGYLAGGQLVTELEYDEEGMTAGYCDYLRSLTPDRTWEGIYSFASAQDPTDPNTTVWLHVFYDKVEFVGMTMPPINGGGESP
jgi:hypothetical protein